MSKPAYCWLSQGFSKVEIAVVFRRVGKDPVAEKPLSIILWMTLYAPKRRGGSIFPHMYCLFEEALQPFDLGCHALSMNCSVVRRIRRRQGRFTTYAV